MRLQNGRLELELDERSGSIIRIVDNPIQHDSPGRGRRWQERRPSAARDDAG